MLRLIVGQLKQLNELSQLVCLEQFWLWQVQLLHALLLIYFLSFHYVTFLLSAYQVLYKNSDHRHITSYYMRMILTYVYLLAETFSGKFCFKLCFVFHAGSGF